MTQAQDKAVQHSPHQLAYFDHVRFVLALTVGVTMLALQRADSDK